MKRKSMESTDAPKAKKASGHWSSGLKGSMEDPELVVEADEKMVIIKDKYPKAKFHFLVLPKNQINYLKQLTKEHIPLLKLMEERGKSLAEKSSTDLKFRFGYHAIPSMRHLHLHVISQDFSSASLKTKRHWNSFTTEYFIDSSDIIEMLEKKGKVEVDTSKFSDILKRALKCHVCAKDFSTMPALKQHILAHIPKGV